MKITSLILVAFVYLTNAACAQAVSDEDRERALKLITAYQKGDSKLERFAVLSDVLVSVEKLDKQEAFSYECNFLQCVDRKKELARYDAVTPAMSASHAVEFLLRRTAIADGVKASWFLNGSLMKSSDKVQKHPFGMICFDAFALPISGPSCFTEQTELPHLPMRLHFLKRPITAFQETSPNKVVVEIQVEEYVYLHVFFEESTGNPSGTRLLVRSSKVADMPNSVKEKDLANVVTKWGSFAGVAVPIAVTSVLFNGPAGSPTTKTTYEAELKWCSLPKFSDGEKSFFSSEVPEQDIMDYVRANASSNQSKRTDSKQ